uniref:RNA polymerase beta' subunit n=1 Tax=Chattonella marina TaxID=90936 RepID=UPI002114054F|nr:RNA polymerase beta' subunit [Chattonella marina]UTE94812.1 RNA polymerase beta' subunit [Chattonella marina]
MKVLTEEFDFIKISIASPEQIKLWAERILPDGTIVGEIKKTDTINYRTFKPEMTGLFCERVFGPIKSGECNCGLYKHARKLGFICQVCGVEITDSRVRRHRMGFVELLAAVTHVWYLKGSPSYLSLLLNIKVKTLENTIYYNEVFPGKYDPKAVLTNFEFENDNSNKNYTDKTFSIENYLKKKKKKHGAEIIRDKLSKLNLNVQIRKSRMDLLKKSPLKRERAIRRIRVLESFILTGANPKWMVLSIIPVIPPGLRPMIQLEGGRFATSDLNELYRKVIMRNNRLGRLFDIDAPDVVIRNEKRLLQEAVDALIDNGRRGEKILDINSRPFKSLSDAIEGKQGRFRQNLLGKRVDYSGRSVITVGPNLKLHQCGLPYEIAVDLFKPFLIYELIKQEVVSSIRAARKIINENSQLIWGLLENILKNHPILLNRAPTLHRLGVQTFEPILVSGRAILLHPLVCTAFNADFDGDQMAVHVPLSVEAQSEAISLLFAPCNFLSPATGSPIIIPSQDMLLGCYYLTNNNLSGLSGASHYFTNTKDVLLAYENKKVDLHSLIWVRYNGYLEDDSRPLKIIKTCKNSKLLIYKDKQIREDGNGKIIVTYIRTTPGRLIFNKVINQSLNLSV